MLHRLAIALGRTVGELSATISPDELRDWSTYYGLEPWGYEIDNFRAAMGPLVAAKIAGSKSSKITDFMRKSPARRLAPIEEVLAAFGVVYPGTGAEPK